MLFFLLSAIYSESLHADRREECFTPFLKVGNDLRKAIDPILIFHPHGVHFQCVFTVLYHFSQFLCSESDWQQARPSSANRVALVKRGDCPSIQKAALAVKYRVRALMIYNDGTSADRISPISVTLGQINTLPALFLSFSLGQRLVDSVRDSLTIVKVHVDIKRLHESAFSSRNVCADTPTGDPTQTIIVGSHIERVRAGPGINDNGELSLYFFLYSPSQPRRCHAFLS